ncbi:hypothetical protein ACMFMG_011710 [Clarireedia jacksonii]
MVEGIAVMNSVLLYGWLLPSSSRKMPQALCPGAWTAIYTPRNKGVGKILKNEFYDMFGSGFKIQSIGTERNPVSSHKKRALFS